MKLKFVLNISITLFILSCNSNSDSDKSFKKNSETNIESETIFLVNRKAIDSADIVNEFPLKNVGSTFQHESVKENSVKYLDTAMALLENSSTFDLRAKDSLLNSSLNYSEKSINVDDEYQMSYVVKSMIYMKMNKYDHAINFLEETQKEKKYPEPVFILGLLYEREGKQELALQKYSEAYDFYKEYLRNYFPTSRDEINMENIILLYHGKEKTLRVIDEKLKRDPRNQMLKSNRLMVEHFNRKRLINGL